MLMINSSTRMKWKTVQMVFLHFSRERSSFDNSMAGSSYHGRPGRSSISTC